MNTYKMIRNAFLFYLGIIVMNTAFLFAQGDGGIPPLPSAVEFNPLFIIPIFSGLLMHWLVKWAADRKNAPSLKSYFLDNIKATFAGLLLGWGAVATQFSTNPAGFASFNPGSFMGVLTTVWALDTVNSNFSKSPAPPNS